MISFCLFTFYGSHLTLGDQKVNACLQMEQEKNDFLLHFMMQLHPLIAHSQVFLFLICIPWMPYEGKWIESADNRRGGAAIKCDSWSPGKPPRGMNRMQNSWSLNFNSSFNFLGSFHSPSEVGISFESAGSHLPPLSKDRFPGNQGNSRSLSSRPCNCGTALPSHGDIPLGSFKPASQGSMSPCRRESPARGKVLETDIDTGFSTVKKAPKVPSASRGHDVSRDSGCYSNGDINKTLDVRASESLSPYSESGRSGHLDTSYENAKSGSSICGASVGYAMDPADTMRRKIANMRESTAWIVLYYI